jgi:hypothetical protein
MASYAAITEAQSVSPMLKSENPAPTMEPIATATLTESSNAPASTAAASKPVNALVVDTGPLIKNEIAISTLLAQAEEIYTIPSLISESVSPPEKSGPGFSRNFR